ncbi:MAG: iron ABC transporter permease, partial [Candidatus Thermofonsia Clade 3 bacterium]
QAALYALPILFLTIFYLYPLLAILRVSFGASLTEAIEQASAALRAPGFWRVLWFTTWQATVSTLLTVPFVMPTVVVAPAFLALIGRNGLLNVWLQRLLHLDAPPIQLEQTIWLILLVHVFYNVAIVIRTVGGFWSTLPPTLAEAAAALGASPQRRFWTVTAPLLAPSLVAASLLVFLFCFTSFGVILILGGLRFATLEVEIYRQAVSYFNLPMAAFLSIVQLFFTFTVMALYTRVQARLSRTLRLRRRAFARRPASWRQWAVVGLALAATFIGVLSPLVALAVRSFTLGDGGPTLIYYQALGENLRQSAFFAPPITAVRNSLVYALATLAISLP